MQAPQRPLLSREAADALEKEILNGRWQQKLPGYRKLCEISGVSPCTMHTALEILARRNIILPAQGTRARLIHPEILSGPSRLSEKKSLIILSDTPLQSQDIVARSILEKIATLFTRKGWTINFESSPEFASGKPGPMMERMRVNRANHRWVLLTPHFSIIKWCTENQLRFICLGGDAQKLSPPLVAVSTSRMLEDSVRRLTKLGHSRICALINHSSKEAEDSVVRVMETTLTSEAISFHSTYNVPKIEKNDAASLRSCLRDLFALSPPSALIATEAHQLIAIYSYCMENGLLIPQDISVIVTQESKHLEWFHPLPSHYKFPINKYVSSLSRWIEHYPTTPSEITYLDPEFASEGSVAPPK